MRVNETQIRKETDICNDYEAMKAKKKYLTEYILEQLALKYYLSERTVQAIIFGEYQARRQRQLSTN